MSARSWFQRFNRFVLRHVARSHYDCRCGAFVAKANRVLHEEFHEAAREFFRPPTLEQMRAANALGRPREGA